tara:strand:+ start:62 stop:1519 length:1458 start_codon:yes stop_codon:yes gene_type:complete
MGKFFLIFTQLFLIILSSTAYAEDYCEDFFDQISKFDTKYEIESNSINQFFSPSGITLGLVYNSKDSWKHLTIDGYPIIKSLLPDTSAYSVLEPNDIILEVDGIDIRNDPTSFRFIEAWNYEINQDIDLLIKRNNGEKEEFINVKITADRSNIGMFIVPELKIKDITEINAKRGTYSINYEFNYYWDDLKLLEIAKQILTKDKDKEVLGFSCKLSEKEYLDYNFKFWQPNIKFKNVIPNATDERKINYYFSIYYNRLSQVEVIEISRLESGVLTLSNKFGFKNFPFDKQILNLDFIQESSDQLNKKVWLSNMWLYDSEYLTSFVDKNNLFDWNINSYSTNYFEETDINYGITNFGITNTFEIQRNATYYLFKIIGPIFLILIVCWSVMWLTAKEVESRLTVTTVCLLSLVAYNFVIDQDLPRLAYFTKMDYIISLSYLFAALPTLIAVLEYRFYKLYNREISFTNVINYTGPLIYITIVFGIVVS